MDEAYEFERRLGRMFDETPAFPDAPLFAARVTGKLETRDQARRMVMGLVGGAGAFLASFQLLRANLGEELSRLSAASTAAFDRGVAALNHDAGAVLSGAQLQGEALWTVAALAALAISALAVRLADQG